MSGKTCHDRVDLTNKVVIVTGASSGIGEETARALAEMNAHVILGISTHSLHSLSDHHFFSLSAMHCYYYSFHNIINFMLIHLSNHTINTIFFYVIFTHYTILLNLNHHPQKKPNSSHNHVKKLNINALQHAEMRPRQGQQ